MKAYIFKCRARPGLYGATRYETGSNLPTDQCSGGWEYYERVELSVRRPLRFVVDTGTLLREIQRNGLYVWDESPIKSGRSLASASLPASLEQHLPPAKSKAAIPPMTDTARLTTADVAPARPVSAASAREVVGNSDVTLPARHQVVWFDIPVRDLDRALRFYSAVLGTPLKKEQAGPGVAMSVLPHADGYIGGCLLQNVDAKPSESGPLVYLNTQGRLDDALNAVEKHGGRVLLSKHAIARFGFRAIVIDSEGNRVALHST